MNNPELFGDHFIGESWDTWRVFHRALHGLPLNAQELRLFKAHCGEREPPKEPIGESWLVVGRRGGKSINAAAVAVERAVFRDYSKVLAPGERGVVLCLASDKRQASVVFSYVVALLEGSPLLSRFIDVKRAESVDLNNRISIEVHTASYKTVRGLTVVCCIADEVAFWQSDESANPDKEIVRAIKPGMASIPGSLLLGISTPYSRRGELYRQYDRHYGQDSNVLVWRGSTQEMNPTIPDQFIADAYEDDPVAASAEYGATFRTDVESFLSAEVVQAVTVSGRHELPRVSQVRYFGFVDPSGGSQDSMTLALAHLESGVAVLDCVRERRPPFSPEGVTEEYAAVLRSYGVSQVTGDRYGGEWPREQFRKHGIDYVPSKRTKSEIYATALPLFNSHKLKLLDHKRLRAQLEGLERRVSRAGRDSIDHYPGGRDDIANAACGALVLAASQRIYDRDGPSPIVSVGRQRSYWAGANRDERLTGWRGLQ
jgi:hypothetical protein